MQISVAILVTVNRAKGYIEKIIKSFIARVNSLGGIFEAKLCLTTALRELDTIGLLEKASLVITPNAYNEGILYDVVPNTTLGDMNVVRDTTATRVNEQGLIEVVPRNLLTQSNNFTSIGGWFIIKDGGSTFSQTSNYGISPDGTQNASRLISSIVNGAFSDYNRAVGVTIGNTYTYSIWIKSLSGTPTIKYFNGNGRPSATLTNDWVRYTYTFTAVNSNCYPSIYIDKNFPTSTSYDILTYGAQLEAGSTATEYFPTTTRLNIPRIDYTNGSCPSLLVEPQRTNALTYSNDYSNVSWGKVGVTAVLGTQVNPEGIASTYSISNTTLGDSYLQKQGLSTTAGNYTMSVFVKNVDNVVSSQLMAVHLTQGSVTSQFTYTWATNTFALTGTNAISGSSVLLSNGWVRLSFTYSIGAGVVNHWARLYANNNLTITKSVLVYGFQNEVGSYPTSYIPTVATSVTRNADVISKTGISSLIGQTEGTIFFEGYFNDVQSGTVFLDLEGTLPKINFQIGSGILYFYSQGEWSMSTAISLNTKYKIAGAYKNNDIAFYVNGVLIATDTSATITAKSNFYVNSEAGYYVADLDINSVQLYKTRLTNSELAQLTTI